MLKAHSGRAVIKPSAKDYEERALGLLIKTDYVEPEITDGFIVAINEHTVINGKTKKTDPDIQVGQHIFYKNRTIYKNDKHYNPLEFTVDGEKYISVEIQDIYGVYLE